MAEQSRIYKALSVAKLVLSGEQVSEFDKAEALEAIVKEIGRRDYEAEMRDPSKLLAEYDRMVQLQVSAQRTASEAAKQN